MIMERTDGEVGIGKDDMRLLGMVKVVGYE